MLYFVTVGAGAAAWRCEVEIEETPEGLVARLKDERERARYAYDARYQAIGRIGLPQVREHRRKRLDAEHQARIAALDDAEASVPDLNAVLMLRIGLRGKVTEARVREAQSR